MPLSLFLDALPYTLIRDSYRDWLRDQQTAPVLPGIGYSANLHWQLYCGAYPDDMGFFTDWIEAREPDQGICRTADALQFLDKAPLLGGLSRKVLNRLPRFRGCFANIPYRYRAQFCNRANYLFLHTETLAEVDLFAGYTAVLQDETQAAPEETCARISAEIETGNRKIFGAFSFPDTLGHRGPREERYRQRMRPPMECVRAVTEQYRSAFPEEEVLLISDHGMSAVAREVDAARDLGIGEESGDYVAFYDAEILKIYLNRESSRPALSARLADSPFGHLLTEEERTRAHVTDRRFGDLIFILKEPYSFARHWFGWNLFGPKSGYGMHGFWPEQAVSDHTAVAILISGKRTLLPAYDSAGIHGLIRSVMKGP